MTKLFYLSELVKFAVEKEKEAFTLYKNLADKVTSKETKDLFYSLAQEEQNHEAFYTQLLSTVPQEQSAGVKEDAEYEGYMQELIAASRSVTPISPENFSNIKMVLDYAAAREKDSILFYVGLKNYLVPATHPKIDIIINEEAKHMTRLLILKKNYV